jgi:colicin import membrane protein
VPIVLRWRLKEDGNLDGVPEILNRNDSFASGFSAAAAIQAVRCASPFRLPKEHYRLWRSIDWNFDPREKL